MTFCSKSGPNGKLQMKLEVELTASYTKQFAKITMLKAVQQLKLFLSLKANLKLTLCKHREWRLGK